MLCADGMAVAGQKGEMMTIVAVDSVYSGALPSERQLAWHALGFYGFLHFTMNTFTGREWGYGDESPALFNPAALDARQWARTARDAGMKGLILTCKHHDGFCLWPSRYTEHSVKNAPWKNGQGDVVRECSDACREFGLKFGVYLSPWDRNYAGYGSPAYIEYFRNQLRELLTNYGPIFEVWFDGANGGDGYYGGAREVRHIDRSTYYDWPNTIALVRALQPSAVMFSDAGPDVRWVGNESGDGSITNWATLNVAGRYPGYWPGEGYNARKDLGEGHEGGTHWVPAEVDVSIRPGWFYHSGEDGRVRTPVNLLELYLASVGRGANLHLNLPPDQRGLLAEPDVESLQGFAVLRDQMLGTTVAEARAEGGLPCWVEGGAARIYELALPSAGNAVYNLIELREAVRHGQRVKAWTLEALVAGVWQAVAEGTTIGYRRLIPLECVFASGLRLCVTDELAASQVCVFAAYRAPGIAREPKLIQDRAGLIHLEADGLFLAGALKVRYTLDGSEPGADAKEYGGAFPLPRGGLVRAAVLRCDNPAAQADVFTQKRFGISKVEWRIHSCSSERPDGLAANLLDPDSGTLWASAEGALPQFVAVDMGREVAVSCFGYLPRQRYQWGVVNRCSFFVSDDGSVWRPVAEGVVFDNIAANPLLQLIRLPAPVKTRYFKFVALGTADGAAGASGAALEVFSGLECV